MHHLSICGRDSCICYCLHCRHWCRPTEVLARGSYAPVRQLIRPRCRPAAVNVLLSSSSVSPSSAKLCLPVNTVVCCRRLEMCRFKKISRNFCLFEVDRLKWTWRMATIVWWRDATGMAYTHLVSVSLISFLDNSGKITFNGTNNLWYIWSWLY